MHICVYVTIKKKEEIMNLKGNEGYEREREVEMTGIMHEILKNYKLKY